MDSKDFERIYASYNPEVGTDNSLETEKLFEDIYFECNMKPLFERVLREMGAIDTDKFADVFARRLKHELSIDSHYSSFIKDSSIIISTIITQIEKLGNTEDYPFAIKTKPQKAKNGKLYTSLYACSENYKNILNSHYSGKEENVKIKNINFKSEFFVILVNKETINLWINEMISQSIKKLENGRIKDLFKDEAYQNTIKKIFYELYSTLPDIQ